MTTAKSEKAEQQSKCNCMGVWVCERGSLCKAGMRSLSSQRSDLNLKTFYCRQNGRASAREPKRGMYICVLFLPLIKLNKNQIRAERKLRSRSFCFCERAQLLRGRLKAAQSTSSVAVDVAQLFAVLL